MSNSDNTETPSGTPTLDPDALGAVIMPLGQWEDKPLSWIAKQPKRAENPAGVDGPSYLRWMSEQNFLYGDIAWQLKEYVWHLRKIGVLAEETAAEKRDRFYRFIREVSKLDPKKADIEMIVEGAKKVLER